VQTKEKVKMRGLLASCVAAAALIRPGIASAFDPQGHQMVGAIADRLLTARATARLKSELGLPLRVAATWADCVKDVSRDAAGTFRYLPDPRFHAACAPFESAAGKARMVGYVSRNWSNCTDAAASKGCHARYHFTDVSIGHDAYDRTFAGTSDHDIVSALGAAISVLQDRPPPKPFAIRDKAEALLLLAHLVGDLHQPLHVGAVYLGADGRRVDPGPAGAPQDPRIDTRGGNRLEDGPTNLHADWDDAPRSLDPLRIAPSMLKKAGRVPFTAGRLDTWPATWAGETIRVSRRAFGGLAFAQAGAARSGEWVTRFDDRAAYMKTKDEVQTRQLTLAGARLAQVLNAIWP
jgi:hypothetical protein